MGNSSGNFKDKVGSVNIELDFEIDPVKGQEELRKFGYYFNKKGECRSIETDERVGRFETQKKYEEFGAALENYVFYLLREQYKMTEKLIKANDDDAGDNDDDKMKMQKRKNKSAIDESKIAKSRIYLSPDYGSKETLLLLIPGSGAVRAGQWARSICINDNLAAGCMYPFIADAYSKDWGVVLFDPNGRTDKGLIFSDDHVIAVYDEYIAPYLSKKDGKTKNVLIVCHSAGGHATTRLLNSRSQHLLDKIRGVAGTDTFFGQPKDKKVKQVFEKRIVNWVTSQEPLGTILSDSVPKRVSAGHTAHEYTSASAFKHIMNFFDSMLKMHNMINGDDKSLEKECKENNDEPKEKKNEEPKCDDKENNAKSAQENKEKEDDNADKTKIVAQEEPKPKKQSDKMEID